MLTDKLFETALGISSPWYVAGVDFQPTEHRLTIRVDFEQGAHFAVDGQAGQHPVHDTVVKQYQHLNFFQHRCVLEVRTPRVKLPDGSVVQVKPSWSGRLSGFTLLFEALLVTLCREMPFRAVARTTGVSAWRLQQLVERYVDASVSLADYSEVRELAIDETSRARGHDYVTVVADAQRRAVIYVAEGRDAATVEGFATNLALHRGKPSEIRSVSMDMSPAFQAGVRKHFPHAQITFDKFHVIAHASQALDETRRIEQRTDPALKGMRWLLLKDRSKLSLAQRQELDELTARITTVKTARAWRYREQLREILTRRQPHLVRTLLSRWCTNVMRSSITAMKKVAAMVSSHLDGILSWVHTQQTNGFLEALNGLFQAAKRKARGYGRFRTIRAVYFLIAGKLDFSKINPHAFQPT